MQGFSPNLEEGAIFGYWKLTNIRKGYKRTYSVKFDPSDPPTLRPYAIVYMECELGKHAHVGSHSVVREYTKIGDYSSIGNCCVVEGYTTIGHHTMIHSNTHITALAKIGNYVFIGPAVTTANARRITWPDPNPEEEGPTLGDHVKVGTGAVILPRVQIGDYAVIGAGAVVTKNVPPNSLALGVPARCQPLGA